MSREGLFNIDCVIRSKSHTSDVFGQFIYSYTTKSTQRCAFDSLSGSEVIALGLPVSTLGIRVYLDVDTDIDENDEIIIDDKIYNVEWINRLGYFTGVTEGIQVDCSFYGFCSDYNYSSSSSSSSESSSSSSIDSSSSSSSSSYEAYYVLSGALTPDVTGNYYEYGISASGSKSYKLETGNWYLWFYDDGVSQLWFINDNVDVLTGGDPLWYSIGNNPDNPIALPTYTPLMPAVGTGTLTLGA